MRRIKLVVAYDGTNYCGWQLQPNGITIEEVLNRALSEVVKEPVAVIGASRTDSGVHARGNVAVFDTESRIPADKICLAANQWLPEDVRIQSSEEVALTWHPRKQNCVKTYEYKILNRRIDMPIGRLYTHFCYYSMDVAKMQEAASYLTGEHDFKSFCTLKSPDEDTVRTIYSLTVEKDEDDVITIRISGSGFLYNMVRIIAGTLIRVGTGMYPPEKIKEILAARNRQAAGETAPAKGLTLVSMEYEAELLPEIEADNEDWKYCVVQREIRPKGKAYILIRRCREKDFSRLAARLIHQCHRNGAKEIYIKDTEPGKDRLRQGDEYGYYTLEYGYRLYELEKRVEKKESSQPAPVTLTRLQKKDRQEWLQLYHSVFFSISGSATYDEEMIERETGEDGLEFLWVNAKRRRQGFAVVQERPEEDCLYIDMLGIRKEQQKNGFGMGLLEALEQMAAKRGLGKLKLTVANDNEPAKGLYRKYGFWKTAEGTWFYRVKDKKPRIL